MIATGTRRRTRLNDRATSLYLLPIEPRGLTISSTLKTAGEITSGRQLPTANVAPPSAESTAETASGSTRYSLRTELSAKVRPGRNHLSQAT